MHTYILYKWTLAMGYFIYNINPIFLMGFSKLRSFSCHWGSVNECHKCSAAEVHLQWLLYTSTALWLYTYILWQYGSWSFPTGCSISLTACPYTNSQNSIISFWFVDSNAKKLSNFVPLAWKLINPYYHNVHFWQKSVQFCIHHVDKFTKLK